MLNFRQISVCSHTTLFVGNSTSNNQKQTNVKSVCLGTFILFCVRED